MTKRDNHFLYYILLVTYLLGGLVMVWKLGPDKNLQMAALVGFSIIYALIGIIHHLHSHDLVGKIVIEYVLVAGLGIAAAFFIFKGGFGI